MTGAAAPVAPIAPSPWARLRGLSPWALALLGLLLAWLGPIQNHVPGPARLLLFALVGLAVGGCVLADVLVLLAAVRGTPAGGRRVRRRSATVAAWTATGVLWCVSGFVGLSRLPASWAATGHEEFDLVALCLVASGLMMILDRASRTPLGGTRPSPLRATGFRWLWLGVLVTTAPVALWEIATDHHIVYTHLDTWHFHPHVPVGTFTNPNNYACVLVAVAGVLLAWALDAQPRWVRGVLVALAAATAALVWATESRGAFAAIALQVLVTLAGLAASRGWADAVRRDPRLRRLAVAGGVVVLALAVAAFVVPALAAHNPLLRQPKPDEAESDALRVRLVQIGLRYWGDAPVFGTGPGTFEHKLSAERPPGVPDPTINLHNGFVEWASQYGALAALPLAVLLAVLLWQVLRPARGGRPTAVTRVELANVLVAFVITGLVVSSSLALPMWFVMLAHAASLAREREAPASEAVTREPVTGEPVPERR